MRSNTHRFKENAMRTDWKLIGAAGLGTLALYGVPALAQVQARTSEVHVYAGQLIGDDLTDTDISGQTPELDDDITYGIRYGYNFTDRWGLELSAGFTPTSVTR